MYNGCDVKRNVSTYFATQSTTIATPQKELGVNDAAVWALMSINARHSYLQKACSVLQLPALSKNALIRPEEGLGQV